MFEAKDILTLIGIPVEKVKALQVIKDEEESIIRIELLDIKTYCPHCGSTQTEIKDYYVVRINNSIIKHNKLTVIIRVRRYRCKKCGRSFKQNYEFVEKGASISNAVKGAILDDLKEMLTMAQIAKDHNVSDMTVIRIFDKCILPQLALKMTEIICVDEFCFKHNKKYGKYPCVITDPLTGKIIDIIESRWKNILIDYFNKVKLPERRYVKYFVSDMNETYRQIKNIFFHDAIHIADRFHLIRLFNDAITAIRTRIIKQEACFDLKEYRYLKTNWKVFLKDRNELAKRKYTDKWGIVVDPTIALDRCLSKYPDLYYAYWTKEEFRRDTKRLMYYGKADELVNFYETKLRNSTIDEMVKVGKTFTNWKREIINGLTQNPYSIRITNAIAESMNNKIQTLIDLCYGIPKFERMRKRVLYINRNQKD